MKVLSFAILMAAAAASASASTTSLRGSDEQMKRDLKVNDIRLLKPEPDQLPEQANTDLPELPEKANANDNGKENGRPFGCTERGGSCNDDSDCCSGACFPIFCPEGEREACL